LDFGYQGEQKKLILRELENFNSSEMSSKLGSWELQKLGALVGFD
jgi:hypothetical protein